MRLARWVTGVTVVFIAGCGAFGASEASSDGTGADSGVKASVDGGSSLDATAAEAGGQGARLVQSNEVKQATASTFAVPLKAPASLGNTLVIVVAHDGAEATTVISQDTWTPYDDAVNPKLAVWVAAVGADAESVSVQVSFSDGASATDIIAWLGEWSGLQLPPTSASIGGNSTSMQTPKVSTSGPTALIAFGAWLGNGASTPSGEFVTYGDVLKQGSVSLTEAHALVDGGGDHNAAWTLAKAAPWRTRILSFTTK